MRGSGPLCSCCLSPGTTACTSQHGHLGPPAALPSSLPLPSSHTHLTPFGELSVTRRGCLPVPPPSPLGTLHVWDCHSPLVAAEVCPPALHLTHAHGVSVAGMGPGGPRGAGWLVC